MIDRQTRMSDPLDYFEPKRPDRVHQDIQPSPADQKRGVTHPRQTKLITFDNGECRPLSLAPAPREQGGQIDLGQEVATHPAFTRAECYSFTWVSWTTAHGGLRYP